MFWNWCLLMSTSKQIRHSSKPDSKPVYWPAVPRLMWHMCTSGHVPLSCLLVGLNVTNLKLKSVSALANKCIMRSMYANTDPTICIAQECQPQYIRLGVILSRWRHYCVASCLKCPPSWWPCWWGWHPSHHKISASWPTLIRTRVRKPTIWRSLASLTSSWAALPNPWLSRWRSKVRVRTKARRRPSTWPTAWDRGNKAVNMIT